MTRSQEIMSNEHFYNLLWQVVDLGAEQVSIFGFGEPLVDIHAEYKVKLASRRCKLETHMTTNASLLVPERARALLGAGLSHIRFSIHALTPDTYANVHRGLNWHVVTRNMDYFRKLNENLGHPCTIHVTCIPQHGESVDEVRELWEPFGDYLEVWAPHNWGGTKGYREGEATRGCHRPFSGPLQIQANGDVIPCCFLTDGEVVLGNTKNHKIETILKGDAYKAFQKKHQRNTLTSPLLKP
jgi:MoaA/NifB/PqqE/SkfB family radical SAM enzyme